MIPCTYIAYQAADKSKDILFGIFIQLVFAIQTFCAAPLDFISIRFKVNAHSLAHIPIRFSKCGLRFLQQMRECVI